MNYICNRLWCRWNFCWGNTGRICDCTAFLVTLLKSMLQLCTLLSWFCLTTELQMACRRKLKSKIEKIWHYIHIFKKQSKGKGYCWFSWWRLRGLIEVPTYVSHPTQISLCKNKGHYWKKLVPLLRIFKTYP